MVVICQTANRDVQFDFFGDPIALKIETPQMVKSNQPVSEELLNGYFKALETTCYEPVVNALLAYKEKYKMDDWLYYQLIRKTVQSISPKLENYERYTVFKWFFLIKSGYSTTLKVGKDKVLFYVQTDEQIFNLPLYTRKGKQYICLNYHDFTPIDFKKDFFTEARLIDPEGKKPFTYRVTQLPNFKPGDYVEKDIRFNYYDQEYNFKVKLNPQVKAIFSNYPVVDYESYFNIPLSNETYQSLIPLLKKELKGMSIKNGVDFLMRFTRYAFLFETDTKNFGQEKRLSPEQTLLYDQSDCEDRAGLFFFLVKEIYNLPMIVLSFPEHITMAVKFDKPVGKSIMYNGSQYSICEPTPQSIDLGIGKMIPALSKTFYEVVYSYTPDVKAQK